tara:strand:- start:7 stop:258 length:252 start_codon:yes stop_codon:yes gene_type:complete
MTPNKKIIYHSFLHGLGRLKLVTPDGRDVWKSQTFLEAGYVYAPYVPMIDPSEFRPRRGMMSRYAERVVNNSFYGIIEHDGAE